MSANPSSSHTASFVFRAIASLFVLFGLALTWQGENQRTEKFVSNYDQLVNLDEAQRFLRGEGFPRSGGYASLGSYIPPGSAWIDVPGAAVASLENYELIGSSILYVLGCFGLYLLVRYCSDERTACVAVAIYSLSWIGLFFAGTSWPRARPAAYVWMAYFSVRWAVDKQPWCLSASLITFALGLMTYLEFAPAIFMLPAIWWWFRPPVRIAPLALGLIVSIIVWLPYFRFEASRDFIDLKSQLFHEQLKFEEIPNWAAIKQNVGTWDAVEKKLGPFKPLQLDEFDSEIVAGLHRVFFRVYYSVRNLSANFRVGGAPGLLLCCVMLFTLLVWANRHRYLELALDRHSWLSWLGVVLTLSAIGSNQWVVEWLLGRALEEQEVLKIWLLQSVQLLAGISLINRKLLSKGLARIRELLGAEDPRFADNPRLDALSICVLFTWMGLCILAREEKYGWGVWILQVAVAAIGVSFLSKVAGWKTWAIGLFAGIAVICSASNEKFTQPLKDWYQEGYRGASSDSTQIMKTFIADVAKHHRHNSPAVGYLMFTRSPEQNTQASDSRYYLGAPWDICLRDNYAFHNMPRPQIGFTPEDDYRIVQSYPFGTRRHRFLFNDQAKFELIEEAGMFQLWRRTPDKE